MHLYLSFPHALSGNPEMRNAEFLSPITNHQLPITKHRTMTPLKSALEQFLEYSLLEKGLSPATLSAYQIDLAQYRAALEDNNVENLEDIKEEFAQGFLSSLIQRGLAASTVSRKISAVRGFHRFCVNENLTPDNPAETLITRRGVRRLPIVIPSELIDRLMEIPAISTPTGLRDRAMLEILYGSGLRISELLSLSLMSLIMSDCILRVTGKGDKTRLVPMGAEALKALTCYLETGRPKLTRKESADKGKVFLNRWGRPIGRGGAYAIVKGYMERVFPGKKYTPHTLRHSFATHLLEGGANIRQVQELLGHESIATTQIYTHLEKGHLREIIQTFHPRG